MKNDIEIKQTVKTKYNEIAQKNTSCGCGDCDVSFVGEEYENIEGHVEDADLGLGCGLPTKASRIERGHVVVDLGSGAGNDVFVARELVGEEGKVIGIDMAESMYERAVKNATRLGYDNVEFRLGEIEDIPLANGVADVVISNCVFNLVPDKQRAFEETKRILKPGGHFAISDIVTRGELPDEMKSAAELYVGCVAGAIDREKYLDIIREAGFEDISISKEREIQLEESILDQYLDEKAKMDFKQSETGIYSITVFARKPEGSCCGGGCC